MSSRADIFREQQKNFRRLIRHNVTPAAATARSKILKDLLDSLPPQSEADGYTPPVINIFAVSGGDFLIPDGGPCGSLRCVTGDEAEAFYRTHERPLMPDAAMLDGGMVEEIEDDPTNVIPIPRHGGDDAA